MPSPSISRASLLRGPGSILYDSLTLFSQQDIVANVAIESWRPQISTHGEGAPRIADATGEITCTPTGRITSDLIAALFPAGYRNPVVGARVFPATDVPLLIHAVDSSKLQFANAVLTRMPSLTLSPTGTAFGEIGFTALIGDNKARDAVGAFYTVPESATWEETFDDGDVIAVPYSGTWGSLSIPTEDGWSVEFEVGIEPIIVDGIGTVDYRITGVTARATCKPVSMSAADLMTALRPEGLTLGATMRQSKDLVITGLKGGLIVTLNDAVMLAGGANYGNESSRVGEITFEASRQLTGTAPSTTMGAVFNVAIAS